MEPSAITGFTLWLRAINTDTDPLPVAERIALELERNGQQVELVDAAALARETYQNKLSGQGLALALGMTLSTLNRHGVVCVVHGSRTPSGEISWKKRKPEKLLDVVLAHEGELKTPPEPRKTGPFLVLRPGSSDSTSPPDPPASAPVGEKPATSPQTAPETGHSAPAEEGAGEHATGEPSSTPLISWDVDPLFDALARAAWIEGRGEGNGADDDTLLRKRLRDLGYL